MVSTKYLYIKTDLKQKQRATKKRKLMRRTAFFIIAFGLSLVLYVVYPILSYQLFYAPILGQGTVIAPVPQTQLVHQGGVREVYAAGNGELTSASQWFPTGNPTTNIKKEYSFAIPKLGIADAKVAIGSDDLSKSLIHYGGSSLPGEYGNAVIFGHSVLPQFFNPKNYMTIFSTLHTIKEGDAMFIKYDNVTYKYVVFDIKVVTPDDISVLEQQFDNKYVTVITCTPPGTLWKRLVVKGRLGQI